MHQNDHGCSDWTLFNCCQPAQAFAEEEEQDIAITPIEREHRIDGEDRKSGSIDRTEAESLTQGQSLENVNRTDSHQRIHQADRGRGEQLNTEAFSSSTPDASLVSPPSDLAPSFVSQTEKQPSRTLSLSGTLGKHEASIATPSTPSRPDDRFSQSTGSPPSFSDVAVDSISVPTDPPWIDEIKPRVESHQTEESELSQKIESQISQRIESQISQKVESQMFQKMESQISQKMESQMSQKLESQMSRKMESPMSKQPASHLSQKMEPQLSKMAESQQCPEGSSGEEGLVLAMLSERPLEREMKVGYVNKLKQEAEMYYEDEVLLCAWITAEKCLRTASRYSEIDAMCSTEQDRNIAQELHQIATEFTQSPTYTAISTKIRLLMDVFKLFGLEERFDISSNWIDGCSFNGRQRMASKDSVAMLSHASGSFTAMGGESGERTSRKAMFRLGSRKGRKADPPTEQSPTTTKKHRFSIRKGKQRDVPNVPNVPNTAPAIAWTEESSKGFYLSHTVNSNGSISVRIKVKMRIPLFQVLAILNETDFYDKWVPYCKTCTKVVQTSRTSMILQQIAEYPWPLKQKETLSFCFGVDALDEFGCILINTFGLAEDAQNFLGHALPPPPKKIPRVPSSHFLFLLHPIDDGKATIAELFANIDPGITTLRSVILPVIKIVIVRAVRGFFHKIGVLATNFAASGYDQKVKENPAVYEWIKRRIAEGVSLGRFRRGSSVQTVVFDELLKDAK